jgi:hypothetical protein
LRLSDPHLSGGIWAELVFLGGDEAFHNKAGVFGQASDDEPVSAVIAATAEHGDSPTVRK